MPILVRNLTLELDEPEETLVARAAHRLRVPPDAIDRYAVVRRSLDARRRDRLVFCYNLEMLLAEPVARQRQRVSRMHHGDTIWQEAQRAEPGATGSEPLAGPRRIEPADVEEDDGNLERLHRHRHT